MTKRINLKRSLLVSLISLVLCFAMLLGTTLAWFTDSVVSGSNVIQSGTLDIVLEYWDGDEWLDAEGKVLEFVKADNSGDDVLWEPGCTYQLPKIRVRNVGSLAANILIKLGGVVGDEKLAEVIDFKTTVTNIPDTVLSGSQATIYQPYENATVNVLFGTPDGSVIFDWGLMASGVVSPNSGHTDTSPEFTVSGHMDENAGNEYQGLSIDGVSIAVVATQQVFEYDSFGREYDSAAPYPALTTKKIESGEIISAGSVSVLLPQNAPEATYTLVVENPTKTENTAGETVFSADISLLKDGNKIPAEAGKEYAVSIIIGKNLVVTGVKHNGEPVSNYTYDHETGIISFMTDSFSPFSVSYSDNVVKVGSAEELQTVLDEIKASAKLVIPGENGDKSYRENVVIILENDIVIDSDTDFMYKDGNGAPLHFYGVRGTLDLNGHSITVSSDALINGKSYANAVLLIQYSNIDIIGEGSIIAENESIPVYGWANSTVNIYGGEYISNSSERNESVVYVNNPTVMINVYGGTYTSTKYAFNVHDNCKNTTTIVLHEGIVYDTFLKNGNTDVTLSDLNSGRIVTSDGCEIVSENGRCTVIAK